MEFYEMKYFIAIWEAKSVSKASEIIHVSQPALSQCIKKVESELNTPLFQRPIQMMKLTEVGELVYNYAKEIVQLEHNMNGAIAEVIHSNDVEIKVGMSPFYSKYYLPSIITHIKNQFPNIRITTVEDISENLEHKLLTSELDFCCVPQDPEVPHITYEPICVEEILLAIPPDSPINQHAVSASPIPYMDTKWVNNQKFVALQPVQKINKLLGPLYDSLDLKCEVVYETLDWDTVNIMIANGIGVGFVPDILCTKRPGEKTPCYYRIHNLRLIRNYSVAYKENKVFTTLERHLISVYMNSIEAFRASHIAFS
ncbi:MAG: LysR family transcriptional regulator [Sphaerochaetaceae bacterium]